MELSQGSSQVRSVNKHVDIKEEHDMEQILVKPKWKSFQNSLKLTDCPEFYGIQL